MAYVSASEVSPRPYNWQPERARNLPETWRAIERHRNPALPLRTSMFLVIFFEETGCCNTIQKPPYAIGPGQIQVADYWPRHFFASENPAGEWKENYMAGRWDSSMVTWAVNTMTGKRIYRPRRLRPDLPELTRQMIFDDFDFGVRMHTRMMEWNWRGHGTGTALPTHDALLATQLGGQSGSMRRKAKAAFEHGAKELERLIAEKPELNFNEDGSLDHAFYKARRAAFAKELNAVRSQIKGNPIGIKSFSKFWEFFLPDGFLESPAFYLKHGF